MASKPLKWTTGILELILAVPLLGGTIVVGSAYIALGVMLVLHILTLVFAAKEEEAKAGSILGIVTSCLAWVPFLGWVLHLVTAIILLIDAAKKR